MKSSKFCLFGAVQLRNSSNKELVFKRRKAIALLSYLLVSSSKKSRQHLAALFWPDLDHKNARNNLRVALSRLSAALGVSEKPFLLVDRQNVEFNPDQEICLDVKQFDEIMSLTKRHEHSDRGSCAHCIELLKEASELYKGDFLEGFFLEDCDEFDEWQSLSRERYRLEASIALADISHYYENTGDYLQAEEYARRYIQLQPLAEQAHRSLIRLLSYQNRRNEALDQFSKFQQYLQQELGVEPELETVTLYHRVRAGEFPVINVAENEYCVAKPIELFKNNIDHYEAIRFVGRELEIRELENHVNNHRLVTILGIGGVGKTSLVLEYSKRLLTRLRAAVSNRGSESVEFSDGVFSIDLGSVDAFEDIPLIVANTISCALQPGVDVKMQVLNHIKDLSMLLIFDNFEHVIEGHAFVDLLLKAAPNSKIITTSRRKLNISAEATYMISGLDYAQQAHVNQLASDEPSNSAAELFVNSAKRVNLKLVLMEDDLLYIDKICELVEGLPLAIVLAASWLESLTIQQISEELSVSINPLQTSFHDMPERHQSIFSAFNYSWQLLAVDEQFAYISLAVFSGGFTRTAAKEVTDVDLQKITMLLNRTLIQHTPEQLRYSFHRLMHQFAIDKLQASGRLEEVRNLHAQYYINLLIDLGNEFEKKNAQSLQAFESDFENIRAAWQWAVSQNDIELLRLGINALQIFCTVQSRYQALIQLLEPVLEIIPKDARNPDDTNLELKLLVSLGTAYISIGGLIVPEAKLRFERALELTSGLDTSPELFSSLNALEAYYWCTVDFDRCLEVIDQWRMHLSHTVHGQRDCYLDDSEVAVNLIEGAVRYQLGEFRLAQEILIKGISLYRSKRHVEYITNFGQDPAVFCRFWLARSYWALGLTDKAKEVAQEAIEIAQEFDHPFTKMFASCAAMDIANFAKDYEGIEANAESVHRYSVDNNFLVFKAMSEISRALVLCRVSNDDATRKQGVTLMEQSMNVFSMQMITKETYASHVVQVYIQEKQYDKAMELIEETLSFVEVSRSFCAYAELLQQKAQVLVVRGFKQEAENTYCQALEVAKKQEAKLLELRVATSYAKYLHEENKAPEAAALISSIYAQIEEGFDTVDLLSAKTILLNLEGALPE